MNKIVQCAVNFSEGRNEKTMREIVIAAKNASSDARIADWSGDPDHNRMVLTLVGPVESASNAVFAAAKKAIELIDINTHQGVHPRLGALDVAPITPLLGIDLDQCAVYAAELGKRLAYELSLPVFLYEAASPSHRTLPEIRKRAFTQWLPDLGGPAPHPTAGAAVVGARMPLIAFNANLKTSDLDAAKRIATAVRLEFAGRVRALGLMLKSKGCAQVSMNVIDPERTSMTELIAFIDSQSPIAHCELIGAIPGFSIFEASKAALKLPDLTPEQILLENWPSSQDFSS